MKPQSSPLVEVPAKAEAERLAEFVLFAQRSCILNLSPRLNRENVSHQQFLLLTFLAKEDSLTMSDVANKLGHSTAAATGQIDRLEQLEFVERTRASADRRIVMVRITEQGRELVARMRKAIVAELANTLAAMDKESALANTPVSRSAAARLVA